MSRKLRAAALLTVLVLLIGLVGCSGKQAATENPGDTVQGSAYRHGPGSANSDPGSQRPNGPGPRQGGGMNESYATALGMTQEQLQAEFQAGKQLSQIVSEHGMTMEQFNQKVLDSEKARLTQEVKDGKITQEQADQSLNLLERRLANPGGRGSQAQQQQN